MQEDIDRLVELAEDNNRMLRKLLNDLRWRQLIGIGKWVIIIGIAFGAYYYLQPYIDKLLEVYQAMTGNSLFR